MKCSDCGKEVSSPIEFDQANFIIYCPKCGMKHAEIEIINLYSRNKEVNDN